MAPIDKRVEINVRTSMAPQLPTLHVEGLVTLMPPVFGQEQMSVQGADMAPQLYT
jgi:hypothetical protein